MAWWRHKMETFSALLALCAGNSPVAGEFPAERPVTRSFYDFFNLHLNKRLSKQSWGWWFEMPSCPLWRHCNDSSKSVCRIQMFHKKWIDVSQVYHIIYSKVGRHTCKIFSFHSWCLSIDNFGPTILSAILVFYSHWLTLFPPWINDHIPCKFGWNYLSIP